MSSQKITQGGYHIGQDEGTLKLLSQRTASTCLAYLLPTLRLLPPNFKLLDVGCGPASITFDLARLFPDATIIGVDFSAAVIDRNIQISMQALESPDVDGRVRTKGICEFRVGDIVKPESFLDADEMGTFDVVNVHASLINIPDSVEALRQMRRIVVSGGIVAARDGDLRSQILWPQCEGYTRMIHAMYAYDKTDIETGRKLISLALQAGWKREQIRASASTLTTIEKVNRVQFSVSMIDQLGNPESDTRKTAALLGLDESNFATIKAELKNFMEAEDGWRIIICTEIICHNE